MSRMTRNIRKLLQEQGINADSVDNISLRLRSNSESKTSKKTKITHSEPIVDSSIDLTSASSARSAEYHDNNHDMATNVEQPPSERILNRVHDNEHGEEAEDATVEAQHSEPEQEEQEETEPETAGTETSDTDNENVEEKSDQQKETEEQENEQSKDRQSEEEEEEKDFDLFDEKGDKEEQQEEQGDEEHQGDQSGDQGQEAQPENEQEESEEDEPPSPPPSPLSSPPLPVGNTEKKSKPTKQKKKQQNPFSSKASMQKMISRAVSKAMKEKEQQRPAWLDTFMAEQKETRAQLSSISTTLLNLQKRVADQGRRFTTCISSLAEGMEDFEDKVSYVTGHIKIMKDIDDENASTNLLERVTASDTPVSQDIRKLNVVKKSKAPSSSTTATTSSASLSRGGDHSGKQSKGNSSGNNNSKPPSSNNSRNSSSTSSSSSSSSSSSNSSTRYEEKNSDHANHHDKNKNKKDSGANYHERSNNKSREKNTNKNEKKESRNDREEEDSYVTRLKLPEPEKLLERELTSITPWLQQLNVWFGAQQVPTKKRAEYLSNFVEKNLQPIMHQLVIDMDYDWDKVMEELVARYQKYETRDSLESAFLSMQQLLGETVQQYYNRVTTNIIQKLDAERKKHGRSRLSEEEKATRFVKGLHPDLRKSNQRMEEIHSITVALQTARKQEELEIELARTKHERFHPSSANAKPRTTNAITQSSGGGGNSYYDYVNSSSASSTPATKPASTNAITTDNNSSSGGRMKRSRSRSRSYSRSRKDRRSRSRSRSRRDRNKGHQKNNNTNKGGGTGEKKDQGTPAVKIEKKNMMCTACGQFHPGNWETCEMRTICLQCGHRGHKDKFCTDRSALQHHAAVSKKLGIDKIPALSKEEITKRLKEREEKAQAWRDKQKSKK